MVQGYVDNSTHMQNLTANARSLSATITATNTNTTISSSQVNNVVAVNNVPTLSASPAPRSVGGTSINIFFNNARVEGDVAITTTTAGNI